MPILDLQRRLREAGRIRLGEVVKTRTGRNAPAKLDAFRLTSSDEAIIRSAASRYGGTPRRWEGAPVGEQWEVLTTSKSLPVLIPPTDMAFSQFYELWSGGGCKRRCDGSREILSDSPCLCDPEARECAPHTRLSLILVDLEGLGLWRLDTQGYYAAVELAGVVELVTTAQRAGRMLPARLGLEQRQIKRIDARTSKPETRNFVVPTLDLSIRALEIGGLSESEEISGLEESAPEIMTTKPLAISEAIAAVNSPPEKKKRANAAPELPPTGLMPSRVVHLDDDTALPAPDSTDEPKPWAKKLHIEANEVAAQCDIDADSLLDEAIIKVTNGRTTSANGLITQREANEVTKLLNLVRLGAQAYAVGDDGKVVLV